MPDGHDHQQLHVHIHGLADFLNLGGEIIRKLDCIEHKQEQLMSAISDFATKQNAHNDKIDAAVQGLTADNAAMTALIKQLQESSGVISAEDQATLDQLEARTAGQADKLEALDALQPPAPPTT